MATVMLTSSGTQARRLKSPSSTGGEDAADGFHAGIRGPSRDRRTILTLAIQIKRHDGRRLLLSPEGQDLVLPMNAHGRLAPRTHLVLAIGQAFSWRKELLRTGGTVEALAQPSGHTVSRAKQILTLTQLAPEVLRATLGGELPSSVTLNDLIAASRDHDWKHQAAALGVPARA